jgi:hypothetical protein
MATTLIYRFELDAPVPVAPSLNCECDAVHADTDTLANLRTKLMRRMGMGAQVANPPPGVLELFNDFIISAQDVMFLKVDEFRGERFFRWPLEEGQRFYDYPDNADTCVKRLDPNKIKWVGIQYDDGRVVELINGINPSLYDHQPTTQRPYRYEIRQCFELFPAPNAEAGSLLVLGHFERQPLVVDADRTTIDATVVFNFALFLAKAHYNKPDAKVYEALAYNRLGDICAAGHATARYIPGDRTAPPPPEPVMAGGYLP